MKLQRIQKDILIIGGGTAGCYAAIWLGENTERSVVIAEKADIRRSGCLAAGVNALNAYITKGHVPQDYVDYATGDAEGIVRPDLLLSLCEELNNVTQDLEKRGLVILKDENGEYVSRGWRNLKINGENIKPILAQGVRAQKNVEVLNHVNITDLLTQSGRVVGAVGFNVDEEICYELRAKAVLIATGGAAGLYRPNNPGASRHQMWYCPFDTGAGYAMGLQAGAEMTTFEMRFIALRCKDTIAPTGTLAQGVHARQVNADGEVYETNYGLKTSERLWGTVTENRAGRGPCYLRTVGISEEQEQDLYKAYLNMAPMQTLKWMEAGNGPASENVEIEGTEPYVVGGHTASGFWVDTERATTVTGLFAAGDVAGGAPQKYVTGALAEGKIAAKAMDKYLRDWASDPGAKTSDALHDSNTGTEKNIESSVDGPTDADEEKTDSLVRQSAAIIHQYEAHLHNTAAPFTAERLEEAMQKIMDEYAGGIHTEYSYNAAGLAIADKKIRELQKLLPTLAARDMDDLLQIYELRERLTVCLALIAHLGARRETRWHSFQENADYPDRDPAYECYVNSRLENGEIRILYRDLVPPGTVYHHEEGNSVRCLAGSAAEGRRT